MITINKQQLKDLNACEDGLERFIIATDSADNDVIVLDLIGSDVTTSDLLWLAGKILPKKRIVQFAVDCAESVIHLCDNKELAQNCVDSANAVIENDNETNRKAARKAAAAAARYASVTAAAVARADTAASAANSAAGGAARAARADSNFDVNPLLIKLFTE